MPPTGRVPAGGNAMEFVVLGVLLFVGAVIAVDAVRQRRIRAARAIDLSGAISARLAEPGTSIVPEALATALRREQRGFLRSCRGRRPGVGGQSTSCSSRTKRGSCRRLSLKGRTRDTATYCTAAGPSC